MKIRRRENLVCRWSADGLQVGLPGQHRWAKVSPQLFAVLDKAAEWTDADTLAAEFDEELAPQVRKALATMTDLGVLVTEDTETPAMWRHWGDVTERFHVDARDANYLVDSPERAEVAGAIVAEGGSPPIFKDYPGAPLVMLPRKPLPLHTAVDEVFTRRRTHRLFQDAPVSLDQLGTLLFYSFAPQRFISGGPFGPQQARVSASAGGRHEVEAYLVAYDVEGVPPGLYHYSPRLHALELLHTDASRARVAELSYHQEPSYSGAFTVFTTAVADRLAWKYRHPRAYRLWMYDAGHYGQTFDLTCTALGLGPFQTVAFPDTEVEKFLGVDSDQEFVAYLLAAGVPEENGALPVDFAHPEPTVITGSA
ncbi:SagB/ThcOx family dehydrogenase [Lentzea sp. NPDC051838]|uniref:SagB/ThcOx family dehydrogenase n=1 Tax=Lentzea sp. NPDC051838 TaxID=3154849 RepID=UPI0034486511